MTWNTLVSHVNLQAIFTSGFMVQRTVYDHYVTVHFEVAPSVSADNCEREISIGSQILIGARD